MTEYDEQSGDFMQEDFIDEDEGLNRSPCPGGDVCQSGQISMFLHLVIYLIILLMSKGHGIAG